jgi:thymidine phosphorylase
MDVSNFINSVASGNALEAKEVLNDLLSSKAFEALDTKKTELAQSLFSDNEVDVQDTEETETETE